MFQGSFVDGFMPVKKLPGLIRRRSAEAMMFVG